MLIINGVAITAIQPKVTPKRLLYAILIDFQDANAEGATRDGLIIIIGMKSIDGSRGRC